MLEELRRRSAVKGEMTLLIGASQRLTPPGPEAPLGRRVEQLMEEQKLDRMTALKTAARERGLSKREAYRLWQHGEEE